MANGLSKHKMSDRLKWIIAFVLIAALTAGLAMTMFRLDGQIKTKEISASAYKVGTLDADGEYDDDTGSIVTKDFIAVAGLKCEVAKNAKITYKVYFFDKDEDYISATAELTADFDETIPTGAKYVKIVITPTNDAEVSIWEISGYVKKLTVTVNK